MANGEDALIFRVLNDMTIADSYPMVRIDETLDQLGKAKYFSKLDTVASKSYVTLTCFFLFFILKISTCLSRFDFYTEDKIHDGLFLVKI
jgi:hypothetical protein